MMRTFFTILLALSSFSHAFACRPQALVECQKLDYRVDQSKFVDLLNLVSSYQRVLSEKLTRPERVTSCFDNRFADYYGQSLLENLKKQNGRTCKEQIAQVRGAILGLIDPQSIENQSVFHQRDKKVLKREAKKISIALMVLP